MHDDKTVVNTRKCIYQILCFTLNATHSLTTPFSVASQTNNNYTHSGYWILTSLNTAEIISNTTRVLSKHALLFKYQLQRDTIFSSLGGVIS